MTTHLNRRQFLQSAGATGVLGISQAALPSWMPRMAFRDQFNVSGTNDTLICVFLRGGMDGLSAVVPYAEGKHYYDNRPTTAVAEPGSGQGSAIDIDGQFGFHPALAPLKDIMDEGDLAVVHATGLTNSSRSHFDAMQFMEYGSPTDKTIGTGWIGRHLQTTAARNDSPFRAIGLGLMAPASLRGPVSPLAIRSIADFHFKGRTDELKRLQQSLQMLYTTDAPTNPLGSQAKLVFDALDTVKKLNPESYSAANGAEYGEDEFHIGLKQVAQIIRADVGLEVACLDLGGWDTHETQGTLDGEFNGLMNVLGGGLQAFYTDMQDHMKNVTVVVMSEFGRTLVENGSGGTDHGHGNVMFLMGGGVRGGQVYAKWPGLAPQGLDEEGDLAITIDYRDVLTEVLTGRMNSHAIDQVFPGHIATQLGLVNPI
ncbi:MAG: hypothetical protein ACI9EW_001835 [Cellvibrionaceae bacterium]|jgi:uncharacterized protein (DUF1501 family)